MTNNGGLPGFSQVSIVIPTQGPISKVRPLLDSLGGASSSDRLLEILVVLNGVADSGNDEESLDWLAKYPKVRLVRERVASLLAGRHRGVSESQGEFLSFLDDDVEVSESWFSGLCNAFLENEELCVAGGPSSPFYEADPPNWIRHFNRKWSNGGTYNSLMSTMALSDEPIHPIDPLFVWGLNLTVRKSCLISAGGFNPDMTPYHRRRFRGDGESGLAKKLTEQGCLAGYFPMIGVTHRIDVNRLSLGFVRIRAELRGIGDAYSEIRAARFGEANSPYQSPVVKKIIARVLSRIPDYALFDEVRLNYLKYYGVGRRYFRSQYREDANVRDWVHRGNYWDFS